MSRKLTQEEFIKRCTEIHGEKYLYNSTVYNGMHGFITIECPEHGFFQQQAYVHINNHGCQECAKISVASQHVLPRLSIDEFLMRALI